MLLHCFTDHAARSREERSSAGSNKMRNRISKLKQMQEARPKAHYIRRQAPHSSTLPRHGTTKIKFKGNIVVLLGQEE